MRRIFVALWTGLVLVSGCGSPGYYSSKERQAVMVKEYDALSGALLTALQKQKYGEPAAYRESGTVDCVRKKGEPAGSDYNGPTRLCSADGAHWLSGVRRDGAFDASKIDAVHLPGLDARKDTGGVVGGSFTENGKVFRVNPFDDRAEIEKADRLLAAAFRRGIESLR